MLEYIEDDYYINEDDVEKEIEIVKYLQENNIIVDTYFTKPYEEIIDDMVSD